MPPRQCSAWSAATSIAAPWRASRRCAPRPSEREPRMSVRLDHGKDELDEVHEINVTPFIDVMLVRLIIFMVAAPLATVDISVDLPSSAAPPQGGPPQP